MRDGIVPFNVGVMRMAALLQHHAVAMSLVIVTKMKSMMIAGVVRRRIPVAVNLIVKHTL